ncbi:MAG: hypothetical protein ACR2GY_14600 [Phycisphaerales bacterium]
MSTERKPGSRGVRSASSIPSSKDAPNFGTDRDPRDGEQKPKGSTKTVSPSASFKRKPRKGKK